MQSNNGKLTGASARGNEGGDRDWAFRTVTLTDKSDLSGAAYVNFVLSKTNVVRLTSRRSPNVRLSDNGTNTIGSAKNDNTLAQVGLYAIAFSA